MIYTVHKAKSQFSKLLREAGEGKEVLIARGRAAKPEFKIVPVREVRPKTRLKPKPSLKKGARIPGAEVLAKPLPPDEWGNLAE